MGKNRKIASRIINSLLILLVIFFVFAAVRIVSDKINNRVPMVLGRSILQIISPSMEPGIPVGTYILIEKISADKLEAGDVITFYSDDPEIYGMLNTHRIKEIRHDNDGRLYFVTKGDNNDSEDAYTVKVDAVIGRYSKNLNAVTVIGRIMKKPAFFILIVFIPALMLFAVELLGVIKKTREIRNEKTRVQEELEKLIASGEIENLAKGYKNSNDKEN